MLFLYPELLRRATRTFLMLTRGIEVEMVVKRKKDSVRQALKETHFRIRFREHFGLLSVQRKDV